MKAARKNHLPGSFSIPEKIWDSGKSQAFEVVQKVKQVNRSRKTGEPELSYIAAPPRMALYVEYSTRIYDIYLKYVAPEDIHVYSIDEVFMDVTHYLKTYGMTAYQLAQTIILDVQDHIGITVLPGSEPTCICAKSQWILWQSTSMRMKTVCALPSWMKKLP